MLSGAAEPEEQHAMRRTTVGPKFGDAHDDSTVRPARHKRGRTWV